MNLLDKTINYFAPAKGLARIRARHAVRIYEGAGGGRRGASWRAQHTAANAEIQLSIRTLRDRARELVRNEPHASRALDIMVAHAIGTGLVPVSTTGSDRIDRQVGDLWEEWQSDADVSGELSFYAMQQLAVRSMLESGEVVIRFIDGEPDRGIVGNPVPLRLQVLESDFIDHFRDGIYSITNEGFDLSRFGVKRTRLGIALGDYDRRIGMWLWRFHPGEVTTFHTQPFMSDFVPTSELIHLMITKRPGQVRGVTVFAPVLATARDHADFIDAVNVKAKVEACFAAFVLNDDPTASLFDPAQSSPVLSTVDADNPDAGVTTLEPGMIKELRSGQDIKFAQPTGTSQIDPVLMYNRQAIASGIGVTYDQLSGDLRAANYSSLRAGKVEFRRLIEQLQHLTIIPKLCERVWRQFISRAVLCGALNERSAGYPVRWVTPAWEPIDPKKDLDAEIHSVRAGRISPQDFISSWGNDWRRVQDDFEAFNKRAEEKGLVFDIMAGAVDQRGRAFSAAPAGAGDATGAEDDVEALASEASDSGD